MSEAPVRILATGFGPFLEHERNPSEVIARALDGKRVGGAIFFARAPLEVAYQVAADDVLRAARDHRVDAVLSLGLAAKSGAVRVETAGRNWTHSASADARGSVRQGAILPAKAALLRTPLDPLPILRALTASAIHARLSDDAGGYVCNDLYFRLLAAGVRAIFVHVPEDVSPMCIAHPLACGAAVSVR
jgi:pyroglutamyl-peptidase